MPRYNNDARVLEQFSDFKSISPATQLAVANMIEKGYFKGYNDGTIKAKKTITRAEAIVLLKRVFGRIITADLGNDAQNTTVNSNLTLAGRDITLKNLMIKGDLYISENAGKGTVTLDNVAVDGDIIVKANNAEYPILVNGCQYRGAIKLLYPATKDCFVDISSNGDKDSFGIGSPAPDFSLHNLKGEVVNLSDYKGKKIVLNYFATW